MDLMGQAMKRRMQDGLVLKVVIEPPGSKSPEELEQEEKVSDLAPSPKEGLEIEEIEENPQGLEIEEIDTAMKPRSIGDRAAMLMKKKKEM